MAYKDLRDFVAKLEREGELKRIGGEVDCVCRLHPADVLALRAWGEPLGVEVS